MRRLLLALPIIALLVVAPSAFAGGWATVGLSSTPAGIQPGKPWNVNMTVLQHGRTPLDGLSPTITIRNGDATKTLRREADRQARRLRARASCSRAPASGPTRSTTASSPASRTRTRPCRSAPRPSAPAAAATTADDGGLALGWLAIGGIALAARGRRACSSGTATQRHRSAAGGVRATILAAGGLACAGAAMTIAAFAGGGSEDRARAGRPPARAQAAHDGPRPCGSQQGCGSCHTFEPGELRRAPIGPDLALALHGKSRDYVMESIVLPMPIAPPHGVGGMPEDFAPRISPQDLDPLVEFLMEGAQNRSRVRPCDAPRLRPRRVATASTTPCSAVLGSSERAIPIHRVGRLLDRRRRRAASRSTCTSRSSRPATSSSTRSTAPASRPATPTTARPARARSTATGLLRRLPARPRRQQRRGRLHRQAAKRTGDIDHLWLRTRDSRPSGRSTTRSARVGVDEPDHVQIVHRRRARSRSSSRRAGHRARALRLPAATNDAVDAFHTAATEAGYESNGAPGERAVYHPGYYGAFVLDPDGHNVEVVNHNR